MYLGQGESVPLLSVGTRGPVMGMALCGDGAAVAPGSSLEAAVTLQNPQGRLSELLVYLKMQSGTQRGV